MLRAWYAYLFMSMGKVNKIMEIIWNLHSDLHLIINFMFIAGVDKMFVFSVGHGRCVEYLARKGRIWSGFY